MVCNVLITWHLLDFRAGYGGESLRIQEIPSACLKVRRSLHRYEQTAYCSWALFAELLLLFFPFPHFDFVIAVP